MEETDEGIHNSSQSAPTCKVFTPPQQKGPSLLAKNRIIKYPFVLIRVPCLFLCVLHLLFVRFSFLVVWGLTYSACPVHGWAFVASLLRVCTLGRDFGPSATRDLPTVRPRSLGAVASPPRSATCRSRSSMTLWKQLRFRTKLSHTRVHHLLWRPSRILICLCLCLHLDISSTWMLHHFDLRHPSLNL